MAVRHFTCLHGRNFASGLKSVGSGWGIDGVGGVLELSVWSQEGTTDWEKNKVGAKGSSKGRDDCKFVALVHFRIQCVHR